MNMCRRKTVYLTLLVSGLLIAGCESQSNMVQPPVTEHSSSSALVPPQQVAAKEIVMYKSPGCECCTKWADHMRKAGYHVVENKRDDMNTVKSNYGVTERLASCHTAVVGGYIIEGHVPSSDVDRLLREGPDIVGLTAPGMPMKSPGMQAPGLPPEGYDVLAFDKRGHVQVFKHY